MRDREFITLLLTVVVSTVFRSTCGSRVATVGFVTTDKEAGPLDIAAFQRAVEDFNGNSSTTDGGVHLVAAVRLVHQHDPLQVASAVCSLLDAGVSAIVDGTAPPRSSIATALCRSHTVPCLAVRPDRHHGDKHDVHSNGKQEFFSISLQPAKSIVGKAASTVLKHMRWSTFTILYDTLDNLAVAEDMLTDPYFNVTIVKVENKQDISSLLRPVLQSGPARVMLTLRTHRLQTVLLAGTNIKETREYFVPDLDARLFVLRELSEQSVRVTTLRMGNAEDTLQEALLRDAVHVVTAGVRDVAEPLQEQGGLCREQGAWQQGTHLLAAITQARLTGASGPLWFDPDGSRAPVNLQVVELTEGVARQTASWSSSDDMLSWSGQATAPLLRLRRDVLQLTGGVRPKLRVALVLSSPYVMVKDPAPSSLASPNDLYEGFCVDLLDGIAKIAKFDYELVLNEEDARYGSYDPTSGEWTGMVGDLVDQRVDVAIGDLSVTEERNAVVDFTDPWLSFGIGLLTYNHDFVPWPEWEDFFMFLQPFSLSLWLLLLATTLLMALLLFLLARLSPCERSTSTLCCEPRSTQSRNPFSLCTSLWFAAGTLFRQFVVVQPRACSTRLLTLLWWFFVVVVAAFYVVSLISCRSVNSSVLDRTPAVQSLYDLPKQRAVKFGAVYGGSTWAFFRDTKSETLQWVYSSMSNQAASSRVTHYAAAIERIIEQEGHYAFLMEEPSIEYIVLRQCDVEQRGGTVGSRSFAIALQQDSVYLDEFNSALSDLRKSGELDSLHDKWWRSQRGGAHCNQLRDDLWLRHPTHESVTVDSLAGAFVVLVVGAVVAVVIAVAECCWEASRLSKQNKSTLGSEVAQQLRLATTGLQAAPSAANSAE